MKQNRNKSMYRLERTTMILLDYAKNYVTQIMKGECLVAQVYNKGRSKSRHDAIIMLNALKEVEQQKDAIGKENPPDIILTKPNTERFFGALSHDLY